MPNITRRDFLKVSAAGTATAILAGCDTAERWETLEPYVNAPEQQIAGVPTYYASTCRQCPAGCGIVATIMNGRAIKLEGNPEHPVNRGKLCARGQAGPQLLYNPDRLRSAVTQSERGTRKYEPVAWNEALNTLIDAINGAEGKVAVWTGSTTSGHLVDLFARFAKSIGAPPPIRYDRYIALHGYPVLAGANSELLDQASLPAYNISQADVVFSFGADFLGTWLSATGYGVEFGRFRSQEFGKRGTLVQFEPRMSSTAAVADKWVPITPGTEAVVAQALMRLITDGDNFGPEEREEAAAACGIKLELLEDLATLFASAEHPLAIPGSTVTGRDNPVEATAAVQALNLIKETIGQPGGMTLTPASPLAAFGTSPVSTLADAVSLIEQMNNGEIDVLLVHGANPAFDLPQNAGFAEALANVGTVVSFSPIVDETAAHTDLILPDRTYLESWGYEVVAPSFGGIPVINSQQPVVPPLYDVYATGDVLLTVAKRVPGAAAELTWDDEVMFLKELVAQLPTSTTADGDADFRWARFLQTGGWWLDEAPAGAQPTAQAPELAEVGPAQFQGSADEYPYYLHMYMSVLLGDGSGASQPWLQGSPDPMTTISWHSWVELNPETAKELDVKNGDIVRVTSPHGEVEAPVYVYPAIRPDTIAMPIGQGHTDLGRYARDRGSDPMQLVSVAGDRNLAWSNLRVKIERTGEHRSLARFESSIEPPEFVHSPV